MNAEPGPFLPCYKCGRQPRVDRDRVYVNLYCDCYDEGDAIGSTCTGRVSDAGAEWDDIMDQEEPRWV